VVPETPPAIEQKRPGKRVVVDSDDEEEPAAKKICLDDDHSDPYALALTTAMNTALEVETSLRAQLSERKRRCRELHDEADWLDDQRRAQAEQNTELKAKLAEMQTKLTKANSDVEVLMSSTVIYADRLRNSTAAASQPVASVCHVCMTNARNRVSRSCGHTLCHECVERWEETEKGHLCVTCRQPTMGYGLVFTE
jgi:hypothetical protein